MRVETECTRRALLRKSILIALAIVLASCTGDSGLTVRKIALLAPFEGQYREIGYNALYAMRLAFADANPEHVQFLAVDDGGTVESAIARVAALNLDPAIAAFIAIGPAATHASVQQVNDKPMILVGNWGHDRADDDSFYAANAILANERRAGDLHMLEQVRDLRDNLDDFSFFSSGSIADPAFHQRYVNSGEHAPVPNLLASLTYDVAGLALAALEDANEIADARYQGINGEIQFEDGFWKTAPRNRFGYKSGQLVQVPD